MRSIVLALTLAMSGSAFAATTYTNPLAKPHNARPQTVLIEFANKTVEEREIGVGQDRFRVMSGKSLRLFVPVGAEVQVYSSQNSKVYGQMLIQASVNDADRVVTLK
jgi:hypothetical protein